MEEGISTGDREIFATKFFSPTAQVAKIKRAVQNRYCYLGWWRKLNAQKFNTLKICAVKISRSTVCYF